ncbi:carbohydrate ABC transporter permease [Streptomyces sp. NPDC058295]|uniref:carbohydrate ABC transporter permease n=1 Tax=Streptomyces sp. NPDC058295 TaxID=3346431 RepID=UPI0036E29919
MDCSRQPTWQRPALRGVVGAVHRVFESLRGPLTGYRERKKLWPLSRSNRFLPCYCGRSRDRGVRFRRVRNAHALPKQKPRPHALPRRYSSQPPTLPLSGRRWRRGRSGGAQRVRGAGVERSQREGRDRHVDGQGRRHLPRTDQAGPEGHRGRDRHATLVILGSAWFGFGFARPDAPGKRALFGILVGSMMLPQFITLLPTYLIFAKLGVVDTYWPRALWGLAATPRLVFLFRQFFAGLPRALEEAAIVDGCGSAGLFWRVFLPQARPVLSASFVIAFTWTRGDYIARTSALDRPVHARRGRHVHLPQCGRHTRHHPPASVMYVVPLLLVFSSLSAASSPGRRRPASSSPTFSVSK